jgi:hypothetical protein
MINPFGPNEICEFLNHCNNIRHFEGFRTQVLLVYKETACYEIAMFVLLTSLLIREETPLFLRSCFGSFYNEKSRLCTTSLTSSYKPATVEVPLIGIRVADSSVGYLVCQSGAVLSP